MTTTLRPLAHLAYLGLGLTAGMTVLGHVGADSRLSAIGSTISDFAAADFTGPVSVGIFLCVAASLALYGGLHKIGAPLTRWTRTLFLTWCGSLFVTAAVPTDDPFTMIELSTAGYVHRYSSALAFVALMAFTWFFGRAMRADGRWKDLAGRVRRMTLAAAGSGAAMVATTYLGDRFLIGLIERGMAAFAVGSLIVVALRVLKLAERPAPRLALAF
ncbi:DUF998 domain-containing protein [Nonomuraea sp. NPDC050663]|uniref:DUF998 domain-containing protein n=1 Tax=Nonomuraea sp. NPDC050663 TaxID=3364370 RepID=UPI00378B398F